MSKMKITDLTAHLSLSEIAIKFDSMSNIEREFISRLLRQINVAVIFDGNAMITMLNVFQLEQLIANYPADKTSFREILEHHKIIWSGQNFEFDLTTNPIVYSIINVTPDSFYDGNPENLATKNILKRVENDLENGAKVIELGGKSSRPGYSDISPEEEWQRLAPAIREIKQQFNNVVLAIDTDEPYVQERVLEAGVDIINDIDGFDTDEKLKILENYKPAVVAMNNGRAGFDYGDNVFDELPEFFKAKSDQLLQIGLTKNQISIDPGVGFFNGDSGIDSLQRVKSTKNIDFLGLPIMIAISRKSFMGNIFNVEPENRLISTLLFEQQMILDGGRILRVHDVKATKTLIDGIKIYHEH